LGGEFLDFLLIYKILIKVAKIKKPVSISPAVLFDLKVLRQFTGLLWSNFKSWKVKCEEKRTIPHARIEI